MDRARATIILLLSAALLLAAGCGSSSGHHASGGSKTGTGGGASAGTSSAPSPAQNRPGHCVAPPGMALQFAAEPKMAIKPSEHFTATLTTSKGVIVARLLASQSPHAVNNFVFLARKGFFTCIPFHRVIPGFMIQTGDPEGVGRGGPGYQIADDPVKLPYRPGTIAMANKGMPGTGGSQFFIVQGTDTPLDPTYPILGTVTSGMKVVNAIATVPTTGPEGSTPVDPVWLEKVTVSAG